MCTAISPGDYHRFQGRLDCGCGIMKSLHNIEKSGFHHGEYVGHSSSGTWRIVKHQCGWRATVRSGSITTNLPFAPALIDSTLQAISTRLEKF